MTFVYDSNSGGYELDAVNDVAGHLHVPDTFDGPDGVKDVTVLPSNDLIYLTPPLPHQFQRSFYLVSLRLPDTLQTIGLSHWRVTSFAYCSALTGSDPARQP